MSLPDVADLSHQDGIDGTEQQVVGAVIDVDDRILLLQRPANDFRGGTWELPSGKVEPGEDLLAALHREVTEETNFTIADITGYLGAFDYLSGNGKRTRQHTWSVTVTHSHGLQLTEHDAHVWAEAGEHHPVSVEVKSLIDKHFESTRT